MPQLGAVSYTHLVRVRDQRAAGGQQFRTGGLDVDRGAVFETERHLVVEARIFARFELSLGHSGLERHVPQTGGVLLICLAASQVAQERLLRHALDVYKRQAYTREAGFGDEVKRRIILGTYALSAGYYDAWYGSAQKVRTLIIDDFKKAFEKVDVLVGPTSPVTAFKFGEKTEDPMAMYAIDITTIPANLAGVPAMSIPAGLSDDGLPVGFQFIAPQQRDEVMYKPAAALEAALEDEWNGPIWKSLNASWLDGQAK